METYQENGRDVWYTHPASANMVPENWERMAGNKMYTGSDYVGMIDGSRELGWMWKSVTGANGRNKSIGTAVRILRRLYWRRRLDK